MIINGTCRKQQITAKNSKKTVLPRLWNLLATNEKQQKTAKNAKLCQQFPACTIRRVPLCSRVFAVRIFRISLRFLRIRAADLLRPLFAVVEERHSAFSVFSPWGVPNCKMWRIRPTGLILTGFSVQGRLRVQSQVRRQSTIPASIACLLCAYLAGVPDRIALGSATMVSSPLLLSTVNPMHEGLFCVWSALFGFGFAHPRAQGAGVDPCLLKNIVFVECKFARAQHTHTHTHTPARTPYGGSVIMQSIHPPGGFLQGKAATSHSTTLGGGSFILYEVGVDVLPPAAFK